MDTLILSLVVLDLGLAGALFAVENWRQGGTRTKQSASVGLRVSTAKAADDENEFGIRCRLRVLSSERAPAARLAPQGVEHDNVGFRQTSANPAPSHRG